MEVFRIVKEAFAKELTASGAASRWNKSEEYVIYTGSSRSLSTLELIVHRNSIALASVYRMLIISIADEENLIITIYQSDLPENWKNNIAYSQLQQIGSDWYKSRKSLILKVPSAIISQEYNYVINTKHPDFLEKVSLVRTEKYFWDERLV